MDKIRVYNKLNLKLKQQTLRNNATPAEKILWEEIRTNKIGVRFHRQFGIGPYILDFYCPAQKLGIELDGSQHKLIDSKDYDKYRSDYLNSFGIKIIRFWNSEVETNLQHVLKIILNNLKVPPL